MRATCIAVLLLTGFLLAGPPAWADFEEGVTAFKASDYERAFNSWKPLAERGDRGVAAWHRQPVREGARCRPGSRRSPQVVRPGLGTAGPRGEAACVGP